MVLGAFMRREAGVGRTLTSTGSELLSYGVPIARWRGGVVRLEELPAGALSVTMLRHRIQARETARMYGVLVEEV